MRTRFAAFGVALLAAGSVLLSAGGQPEGSAATQLQVADLLYEHDDFRGAMGVYQRVVRDGDPGFVVRARMGAVRSALRLAEFDVAAVHADALRASAPADPEVLALSGDSLWGSGRFEEAEVSYRAALGREPTLVRAHRGLARVLASRNRLDEALGEAQAALGEAPGDADLHHTIGTIHERLRRFPEAASSYAAYLRLARNGERLESAEWVRNEINFLRSFGSKVPCDVTLPPGIVRQTVPFRLVDGSRIVVRAKVNGRQDVDFTIDTGAEQTVVTADTARRLGLDVMGETVSAGVGLLGLRNMQIARIDTLEIGSLRVGNVRCLVKTPPIRLPMGEVESLSPLALGLSLRVDYERRQVTMGRLDAAPSRHQLPLWMTRLATVRGLVDGHPAPFIVDTGGQAISLNAATARRVFKPADWRRIRLRVYGVSGPDPEAYLLPGISLAFDEIQLPRLSVVVLDLRAPSVLLGYQIGGIVGHRFLSRYRVDFDLERSVLRLTDL